MYRTTINSYLADLGELVVADGLDAHSEHLFAVARAALRAGRSRRPCRHPRLGDRPDARARRRLRRRTPQPGRGQVVARGNHGRHIDQRPATRGVTPADIHRRNPCIRTSRTNCSASVTPNCSPMPRNTNGSGRPGKPDPVGGSSVGSIAGGGRSCSPTRPEPSEQLGAWRQPPLHGEDRDHPLVSELAASHEYVVDRGRRRRTSPSRVTSAGWVHVPQPY
jgi:hypothetical protein